MPTIQQRYDALMAERETTIREVSAHFSGQLDALWHLIEHGLGTTDIPDKSEDATGPGPDVPPPTTP